MGCEHPAKHNSDHILWLQEPPPSTPSPREICGSTFKISTEAAPPLARVTKKGGGGLRPAVPPPPPALSSWLGALWRDGLLPAAGPSSCTQEDHHVVWPMSGSVSTGRAPGWDRGGPGEASWGRGEGAGGPGRQGPPSQALWGLVSWEAESAPSSEQKRDTGRPGARPHAPPCPGLAVLGDPNPLPSLGPHSRNQPAFLSKAPS